MELKNLLLFLSAVVLAFSKKTTEAEEVAPTVSFNLESGFYDEESIDLEIIASDPDAEIYYTTDGSIPTDNSTKYEGAITLKNRSEEENVLSAVRNVSPYEFSMMNNYPVLEKVKKGNVIRAIAKLPNGKYTDIANGTFFVGLDRKDDFNDLPVVSMITDPFNLFDYEKGIYTLGKKFDEWREEWCAEHPDPGPDHVPDYTNFDFNEYVNRCSNVLKFAAYKAKGNYNNKGKKNEKPAYVEYFPRGSNEIGFAENLGIRIMGSATRTYYQKSFHLTFREDYGKKNLKYEIIPDNMRSDGTGPVTKYKSFNLRNGGNDCEYTKVRDRVIQDLVSNIDSIETQQQDLAVVYIDGEYWGIYSVVEDYTDNHIANNYDIDNKNVVIIKTNEVEAGEDEDIELFNDLVNYITKTDLSVESNYKKAKEMIDVESFAWFLAITVYVENTDGILQDNNWAMWRVREPQDSVKHADGKWRGMIYGIEYSTGIYGDRNYDRLAADTLNTLNNTVQNENVGTQIFTSLLSNDHFKNLFINDISDLVNIDFTDDKVNSTIHDLTSSLKPLVKDQYDRFGPNEGRSDPDGYYDDQVNQFNSWLIGRHETIMKNIADIYDFEDPVTVTIESNNYKKGGFVVNTEWKVFDEKYEGDYFKENILYITAKPFKKNKNKYSTLNHWKLENCEFADKKYQSNNESMSREETIGIYPSEGCKVKAFFS